MPRLTLAQLQPGPDLDENLRAIAAAAADAAAGKADCLLLPEYASFLHGSRNAMLQAAQRADDVIATVGALAAQHGIWILLGSAVVPRGPQKMFNRCMLFNPAGHVVVHYDKLHMFDVELPDGRAITESKAYEPGTQAIVAQTPFGDLGLSVCYDLRFPHLYRSLAQAGANIIIVPSAFAVPTGKAHWSTLLTARAIENAAYVLAPATCGVSPGDRATYGHTLAIDPWGKRLSELADEPGTLTVDLDLHAVNKVRQQLPSLRGDRAFDTHTTICTATQEGPASHVPTP